MFFLPISFAYARLSRGCWDRHQCFTVVYSSVSISSLHHSRGNINTRACFNHNNQPDITTREVSDRLLALLLLSQWCLFLGKGDVCSIYIRSGKPSHLMAFYEHLLIIKMYYPTYSAYWRHALTVSALAVAVANFSFLWTGRVILFYFSR